MRQEAAIDVVIRLRPSAFSVGGPATLADRERFIALYSPLPAYIGNQLVDDGRVWEVVGASGLQVRHPVFVRSLARAGLFMAGRCSDFPMRHESNQSGDASTPNCWRRRHFNIH